jgi:hypothetical protein
MSKEIISQEIDEIMETIAEQWSIIRSYEEKIPLIELDILRANIRKLYEDIYLVDKMNKAPVFDTGRIKSKIVKDHAVKGEPEQEKEKPPVPVKKEEPIAEAKIETEYQEPEITDNEPDFLSQPQSIPPGEVPAEVSPVQEEVAFREIFSSFEPVDEDLAKTAEVQSEEPVRVPSPEPTHPATEDLTKHDNVPHFIETPPQKKSPPPAPDLFGSYTPSIADKFHSEKKTMNDQLAAGESDNSIGNKMQQSQITDLKSAIGINDKFLFINELFKGDLAGYNRAIENLNFCHSKQEALEKLNEMREQFNWSEQTGSYLRLTDFLKRRYAV